MTPKRQDGLRQRLEHVWTKRKLAPRDGHEISAAGKEVRTPSEGEFFTNLEKAADELTRPKRGQDGGGPGIED